MLSLTYCLLFGLAFSTSLPGSGTLLRGPYSNTTLNSFRFSPTESASSGSTTVDLSTQVSPSSSTETPALLPGAVTSPPALVSVSTTISGTPTVVAILSGEDLSLPLLSTKPTTTVAPTQLGSQKASLESELSSIFPGIQEWLDTTPEAVSDTMTESLDRIVDDLEVVLSEVEHDVDDDATTDCKSSLFSLVGCIIESVTKIKTDIVGKVVEGVRTELEDLISLTKVLPEITDSEADDQEQDQDQGSTAATSSAPSSSSSFTTTTSSTTSSCSSATADHYAVVCTPLPVTIDSSITTTISCTTHTSAVSGCSVSDYATTTTVSCSAKEVTDTFVVCQPTVTGSATTTSCSTTTTVTSGCQATVSTSTASLYDGPGCAQTGCASCTATSLPTDVVACKDCTTIDGVPYPSQQTILPSRAAEVTALVDLPSSNDTLVNKKRSLPTPDEYYGEPFPYAAFFKAQFTLPNVVRVPHREFDTDGSSSALIYRFETDSRLTMTLQGLYGCSSLILISRKGVYINHMFENPGFKKYEYDDQGRPIRQIPSDFEADIANAVPNGDMTIIDIGNPAVDGLPWLPSLNAHSEAGELLDPAQEGGVKAFLVSPLPHPWQTGPYRYNNEINTIRNWVQGRFQTDPVDFIYSAYNAEISNNANWAWGKVIFQYDPNEATVQEKFPIGGLQYTCPVQYAGLKLWIGYQEYVGGHIDPFYEDNWALSWDDTLAPKPYATMGLQLPNGGGSIAITARDEPIPSVCVKVDGETSTTTPTSTSEQSTTTYPSGWVTSLPSIVTMIVTPSPVSITTQPLPSVTYVKPSPSLLPTGPTCWSETEKTDYASFDRAQALAAIDWFAGDACFARENLTAGYGCILYHDPCLLELDQPRVDVVVSVEQVKIGEDAFSYALDADEMRNAILSIVDDCDTTTQHLKWGGWSIVEGENFGSRRYNISATTSEPQSPPPFDNFVGVPIERGATAEECQAWDTTGE